MPHLQAWQWVLAAISAAAIGVSKTGVAGLGVVAIALFALVFPTRESVGIVLPILISADMVAVTIYRRNAVWSHLRRLFPWAALGIILGYFAMGRINDRQVAHLVGMILIGLVLLQFWRRRSTHRKQKSDLEAESRSPQSQIPFSYTAQRTPGAEQPVMGSDVPLSHPNTQPLMPDTGPLSPHFLFAASLGMLAGFTTMVANAAGPIMILYLLAMRLPKIEFIGTAAWYFMILNLFKVPFSVHLGLISPKSLPVALVIAPFAVLGALFGHVLLHHIDQDLFETLALVLTLAAAVKLVF